MSNVSYTMLTHKAELSYKGDNIKADAFYGNTDGLQTVSVKFDDFVGRVYIEGTLATTPTEQDWFPIYLTSGTTYKQYPVNSAVPTGTVGDTGTDGFTFRVNAIYLRARIDRSYLGAGTYSQVSHGRIDQILLNV